MDGPVLEALRFHTGEFALESFRDFFVGKRTTEEPGHLQVTPKLACEWKVFSRPAAKPEPLGPQEIGRWGLATHEDG